MRVRLKMEGMDAEVRIYIPGPPFGTEKLAQTKFWYTKVENEQVLLLT